MHEALCRPSGTTLDIVHAERRAADHSANIGSKLPTLPRIILPVPACAMKGRWDFGKQRAGTARQFGETPSVHARSEDSLRFCPYRLPVEGRDPCQPWAPSFASETSCWRER